MVSARQRIVCGGGNKIGESHVRPRARTHTGTRVIVLAQDLEIRIINAAEIPRTPSPCSSAEDANGQAQRHRLNIPAPRPEASHRPERTVGLDTAGGFIFNRRKGVRFHPSLTGEPLTQG